MLNNSPLLNGKCRQTRRKALIVRILTVLPFYFSRNVSTADILPLRCACIEADSANLIPCSIIVQKLAEVLTEHCSTDRQRHEIEACKE